MAKQGQQSPPLPKQIAPPNEEDPALATTTLFPDISQVSNSTSDILKKYFENQVGSTSSILQCMDMYYLRR